MPKASASNFARKSEEFLRSAEAAAEREDWDAAVSHAVHAGIVMADALSVFYLGQRSAAQDHRASVRLFESLPMESRELAVNARHLLGLLAAKTRAEYEDRLLSKADAMIALDHARRFCEWARGKLAA